MKVLVVISMLSFSFMNSFSQKIEIALLYNAKWMLEKGKDKGAPQTYISGSKNITDHFTIQFEKNGEFLWDSNPSCGTHIGAVSGAGSWMYDEKNNLLTLDFKNVVTESGETRGKEKYQIISFKDKEMLLNIFK
jgi:hypothetical protein